MKPLIFFLLIGMCTLPACVDDFFAYSEAPDLFKVPHKQTDSDTDSPIAKEKDSDTQDTDSFDSAGNPTDTDSVNTALPEDSQYHVFTTNGRIINMEIKNKEENVFVTDLVTQETDEISFVELKINYWLPFLKKSQDDQLITGAINFDNYALSASVCSPAFHTDEKNWNPIPIGGIQVSSAAQSSSDVAGRYLFSRVVYEKNNRDEASTQWGEYEVIKNGDIRRTMGDADGLTQTTQVGTWQFHPDSPTLITAHIDDHQYTGAVLPNKMMFLVDGTALVTDVAIEVITPITYDEINGAFHFYSSAYMTHLDLTYPPDSINECVGFYSCQWGCGGAGHVRPTQLNDPIHEINTFAYGAPEDAFNEEAFNEEAINNVLVVAPNNAMVVIFLDGNPLFNNSIFGIN